MERFPMSIHRLFDVNLLNKYIEEGWIDVQSHPTLPLNIFNYSRKTQYKNFWNDITKHCRGLIVEQNTGRIVGNCLIKFFNHDHYQVDTSGPVQVTDKLDGSYLSVCLYNNEIVVATRGSFDSPQARIGKKIIEEKPEYKTALRMLCQDSTAIFEVIYPENRIVLDYGDMRDIVLIGTIANFELSAGKQLWTPAEDINWPGRKVTTFKAKTYAEALAMPPRENAEGIVIYFENSGERVKIKQEDYKALHRIMTDCTSKRLWEHLAVQEFKDIIKAPKHWGTYLQMNPEDAKEIMSAGSSWQETFLEDVPDEFDLWVRNTVTEIVEGIKKREAEVRREFNRLWEASHGDRKSFALATLKHPNRDLMFYLLDGQDDQFRLALWREAQPAHERPFLTNVDS